MLRTVTAAGDPYAIGRALGQASALALREIVPAIGRFRALVREWRGSDRVRGLEAAARAVWPRYVREIEGIADGAGIAFETVFLWNCRGDLPEAGDRMGRWTATGGTTVTIPQRGERAAVIAHNEDDEPELHGHCRIVDVQPDDAPGFVSFYSPGLIPGHAFAVNRAGLVQAIDDVLADSRAIGVPRHLVCRAVLDCEGLDDAVSRIGETVRAGGFHHSLGRAGDRRLLSVEAPANGWAVREVNVPCAHASHLLHERFAHLPQPSDPSSRSRQARADALIAGGAVGGGDPLCVLGDVGARLPIHRREKDAGDPGFTLATAVFRIAGTHVDCEVFDDLLRPPAYRGRLQSPGSPHPSDSATTSAPARPPRGGSDRSIRRP